MISRKGQLQTSYSNTLTLQSSSPRERSKKHLI